MLRQQLPVRSPLPAEAVAAGMKALLGDGAARQRVTDAIAARYPGAGVLLTDSGTTALALALRLSAEPTARPVAIPAYGCYDLATAVDTAGVPFLLYDLDPATLQPDLASLRQAFDAGADRVVIVHLYGLPVDVPLIRQLAVSHGAKIIEDAAQGDGATLSGSPLGALGALGDLGVLSFGRGKGTTGGRGGALLRVARGQLDVSLPELPFLAEAGSTGRELIVLLAQWLLARPSLYWLPASLPFLGLGQTTYQPPHSGTGLSRLAAGVLEQTLPLSVAEAERRRMNALRLQRALDAATVRLPRPILSASPGYLRFPIVLDERSEVEPGRARKLGIMPGYPQSLADLDGFGPRRQNPAIQFPGSRQLARRLWTLPTHGGLSERDLAGLESWCRELVTR